MRTNCAHAARAVIGKDILGMAYGVLYWHDNELDAYRDAKTINNMGGNCWVVKSPKGVLSMSDRSYVRGLIEGCFGD